ncbi:MAG: GMC family oxidoreductase [Deltaproteobacteria bacterium]|nr:GMC family oxidoreductase [Deltaproteobacteria bacterium]
MILDYQDYENQRHYEADVIVVGTGAGGAVVGAELAEAGLDVLFLEEGGYHPTASFNPHITETIPRLYRDAGSTILLGKPPIAYLEGRCVGGSTVINGGMSWRTPEGVLEEWERTTGDPGLGPAGLEPLFEKVEERVSVRRQLPESVGEDSRIMREGAEALGWRYETNQRNQVACIGANNCSFGCPTGAKQSTLVSYMPRAFRAGARCLTEVRVDRLIIEGGRCVGVSGRAVDPRTRRRDRRIHARARAVVVACGAVQTPVLLLRHRRRTRGSGHLGRHLAVHPNVKLMAIYPFEVQAWKGVSQAGQVREFRDEGILFAENFIGPGALGTRLPHHGAEAWELMRNYNRMLLTGVLIEDSTSGRVRRGPFGLTIAEYNITPYDHQRFIQGACHLAELHFTMGAEMVVMPFTDNPYARSMDEVRRLAATQTRVQTLEVVTMHLMGTARMGKERADSAVDLDGQVWDLPGCYVADASVFPTPIGVNPQITIMALATRIANRLADRMGAAPGAQRLAG